MNIYVGNLGQKTSETKLRELFSAYGEVTSVKIIVDQFTGRPKGFGFIEMTSNEDGNNAIEALNNSTVDAQFITVNEARPKAEKSNYGSSSRSFDRRY